MQLRLNKFARWKTACAWLFPVHGGMFSAISAPVFLSLQKVTISSTLAALHGDNQSCISQPSTQ
jgi:fumarate reductase subunit D